MKLYWKGDVSKENEWKDMPLRSFEEKKGVAEKSESTCVYSV